jgi:peptidoglycan hydrolase CwlO-like protein
MIYALSKSCILKNTTQAFNVIFKLQICQRGVWDLFLWFPSLAGYATMEPFMNFKHFFTGLLLLCIGLGLRPPLIQAAECDQYQCSKDNQSENEYLDCIKDKRSCLETQISKTQQEASSFNNTISILNGQIQVQELQIAQTRAEIEKLEREITELATRITGLELSLDRLTTLLVARVGESYRNQHSNPLLMILTSDSLTSFMTQYRYAQVSQEHLSDVMHKAEEQRTNYDTQKSLKEEKQTEIEKKRNQLQAQQNTLTKQRAEQQTLLQQVKNNQAGYQRELEKTLAELEAIQSIIAGKGNETASGHVEQGAKIASVIAGASPCSTGSHLHFEVVRDGVHRDPAGYLKNIEAVWNNQPDSPFGLGGDWEWPLENPARINQGYGMTWYARVKRSYGGAPHTGIDMFSKTSGNYTVKAVKPGTLYRGSIACGGGLLKYVKLAHDSDGFETYYLHVNY